MSHSVHLDGWWRYSYLCPSFTGDVTAASVEVFHSCRVDNGKNSNFMIPDTPLLPLLDSFSEPKASATSTSDVEVGGCEGSD